MKKFPLSRILLSVLLGVLVMLSSTNLAFAATNTTKHVQLSTKKSSGPGDNVLTCLGNILLQVAATALDGEEFTFGTLASSASACVDAAVAVFSPPSNPTPSSPTVDINSSPSDSSFSGSVQSSPVANCTDSTKDFQFNFYVPFEMVVGPSGNQDYFPGPPTSVSTDNGLVAQQVFAQYGNVITATTTSGPSQSIDYSIPPHTQAVFTLSIVQHYKTGEARIVHTDGSTVSLPWLFTDGYQQIGSIAPTVTMISC